MRIAYIGKARGEMKNKGFFVTQITCVAKAKGTTPKEIWLFGKFGRKIEPLEDVDFSRN